MFNFFATVSKLRDYIGKILQSSSYCHIKEREIKDIGLAILFDPNKDKHGHYLFNKLETPAHDVSLSTVCFTDRQTYLIFYSFCLSIRISTSVDLIIPLVSKSLNPMRVQATAGCRLPQ